MGVSSNSSSRQGGLKQHTGRDGGLSKSQERIYSAQQLGQALKSSITAVRDQLQVLTILDSSASSWPGIQLSMDDLEFLIDQSTQTTGRIEKEHKANSAALKDAKDESNTLKETLALQNESKTELARQVKSLDKEVSQLTHKLDGATKEVSQQKQELWALEKQRADLASEMERVKQDNEFMEGEINTLRATVTEQMQQITTLKEDLATRKADVSHLRQATGDQKGQIEHLKHSLDNVTSQLRETSQHLNQANMDRAHFEKEAGQMQDECARLTAELHKTLKELSRLKEWQEVLKKMELDKLREQQDGRNQDRMELEAQKAAIDKALATSQSEVAHKEERLLAKAHEADQLSKQLSLAGVHTKALQKQVAVLSTEKAAVERQASQTKAQAIKMQAILQQSQLTAAQTDKEKAMRDGRTREGVVEERTKIQAAMEEAVREAAVQKTLAEGWARDMRDIQTRLRDEQAKVTTLQARLDEIIKDGQMERMGSVKGAAGMEAAIQTLQQQATIKDAELNRVRAEMMSDKKRLQKHVEALQRECNESAYEVERLRGGLANRLPIMAKPITMSDELENLKRMLQSMPAPPTNSFLPRLGSSDRGNPVPQVRAQLTR
mmetsp:Transcript_13979/g.24511  ORF Transcript_13979/g.24511 Transcript_13979/m.24511 type:complete len:609 (+) Transcript_13979:115-1941(+)|eukprot:CAMPEP_0119105656 /NCGR_PEP_ID=MMETSP1180-20130426/3563_1 /TAXON_ID=3052 ORGANISM="Chlamydomonas cf sp, Strain CCMP681" /NCGR_SAMPLE_ID=MMETSP1180 /ASSEMBLY_ACC=CAM_ASM_000741 /LENGTH=608 /DNA_ID=CAMNT_0007090773 /DNA_START=104 /DNA_END=1930 /DNA_ORIENTATION=+